MGGYKPIAELRPDTSFARQVFTGNHLPTVLTTEVETRNTNYKKGKQIANITTNWP